jgi:RNA polymerase sigma-70 factor (ECF subfamily)
MIEEQGQIVRRLALAARCNDRAAFRAELHAEVGAVCDGGPWKTASGTDQVTEVALTLLQVSGAEVTVEPANGSPSLVIRRDGAALAVLIVTTRGDRVVNLWAVTAPAKVRRWCRP